MRLNIAELSAKFAPKPTPRADAAAHPTPDAADDPPTDGAGPEGPAGGGREGGGNLGPPSPESHAPTSEPSGDAFEESAAPVTPGGNSSPASPPPTGDPPQGVAQSKPFKEPAPSAADPEPPLPPASPAVEALIAEVAELVAKLPANWREAAARLCDDARQVGTVEFARMIRNSVAEFCRLYPPLARYATAPHPGD